MAWHLEIEGRILTEGRLSGEVLIQAKVMADRVHPLGMKTQTEHSG